MIRSCQLINWQLQFKIFYTEIFISEYNFIIQINCSTNMCRLLIFIIFNFFILSRGYSQPSVFSRVYDVVNGNETGTELLILENNNYLLECKGVIDPQLEYSPHVDYLITVDSFFNISSFYNFGENLFIAPAKPNCIANDTVYIFGSDQSVLPHVWRIFKFNTSGDSLGIIEFKDLPDTRMVADAMFVKDDYLYLAGRYYFYWANQAKILIMKIDKAGNIIKQNRFLDIAKPENRNTIYDMIMTSDSNFIVIFGTFTPTYLVSDQQKFLQIIKFDSNLNVIWNSSMNSDLKSHVTAHITETDDGGFVVSWSLYRQDLPEEILKKHELNGLNPRTITRFDKNGLVMWSDTLWTKLYGKGTLSPDRWIEKLITTRNGDIVGIGRYQDRKPEEKNYAYMFRYSAGGTLLWEKIYKDVNYECDNSYFTDVKEADNGDLVCTGELWDKNGARNDATYTWLVRVDSMGCFEPGCCPVDTLQMIYVDKKYIPDNIDKKNYFIIISPNPADDMITISLPEYCASDYCCDQSGILWTIYDTQGRKIKYGLAPERWSKINISVRDLHSGIYFVNIFDNRRSLIATKKLVIK